MLDESVDGRERAERGLDGRRCGFSGLLGGPRGRGYRHDWRWTESGSGDGRACRDSESRGSKNRKSENFYRVEHVEPCPRISSREMASRI